MSVVSSASSAYYTAHPRSEVSTTSNTTTTTTAAGTSTKTGLTTGAFSYANAAASSSSRSQAPSAVGSNVNKSAAYDEMLSRAFGQAPPPPPRPQSSAAPPSRLSTPASSAYSSAAPYQPKGWQGAAAWRGPAGAGAGAGVSAARSGPSPVPAGLSPPASRASSRTAYVPAHARSFTPAHDNDDDLESHASFSSSRSFHSTSTEGADRSSAHGSSGGDSVSDFQRRSERGPSSSGSETGQSRFNTNTTSATRTHRSASQSGRSRSSTPSLTSNNTDDILAAQQQPLYREEPRAPVAVDNSGWAEMFGASSNSKQTAKKQPVEDTGGNDPELDDLVSQINALGTVKPPKPVVPPPRDGAWTLKTDTTTVSAGKVVAPETLNQTSHHYMEAARKQSQLLHPAQMFGKRPKLLVLDINNTLLYRKKATSGAARNPTMRPYLSTFLEYITGMDEIDGKKQKRFAVMIWSSAQPENVKTMLYLMSLMSAGDAGTSRAPLLKDVWARDSMDLTAEQYNSKFPTIKDLNKVWNALRYDPATDNTISVNSAGLASRTSTPAPASASASASGSAKKGDAWSQYDTVLLDDSASKTALQPYNHLLIPAWKHQKFTNLNVPTSGAPPAVDNCLLQAIGILEELRHQSNVSNAVMSNNFRIWNNAGYANRDSNPNAARTWEKAGRKVCEKLGIEIKENFDSLWPRKHLITANGNGQPGATENGAHTAAAAAAAPHLRGPAYAHGNALSSSVAPDEVVGWY